MKKRKKHVYMNQAQTEEKTLYQGWRMVKSETRRDTEILVRNPSPRLFGKKFRDSKKVKTNHAKTRLRDFEILPKFSETHVFRGTIRHPFYQANH